MMDFRPVPAFAGGVAGYEDVSFTCPTGAAQAVLAGFWPHITSIFSDLVPAGRAMENDAAAGYCLESCRDFSGGSKDFRMIRIAMATVLMVLPISEAAVAMPPTPTVAQLLDICLSSTVSEAAAKGSALGWGQMRDQETAAWRTSFLAYNGGSVDVIGWWRGENEGAGLLSFWIAKGANSHRACSYSLAGPSALLDALTEHLGTPDTLDKSGSGATAYWKKGAMEVSFSQFGSSTGVNIAHSD